MNFKEPESAYADTKEAAFASIMALVSGEPGTSLALELNLSWKEKAKIGAGVAAGGAAIAAACGG